MTVSKQSLRQQMRQKRRALSPKAQRLATQNMLKQLHCSGLWWRFSHIAIYLPNDGEINPQPLIREAKKAKKTCWLPMLHPTKRRRLWFGQADSNSAFKNNRFGIPEPQKHQPRRAARFLGLVLLPLVAFDRTGRRLGMGGGYYDKTFAFRIKKGAHCPTLIGLAHDLQEVDQLNTESWDVPLSGILTNKAYISLSKQALR